MVSWIFAWKDEQWHSSCLGNLHCGLPRGCVGSTRAQSVALRNCWQRQVSAGTLLPRYGARAAMLAISRRGVETISKDSTVKTEPATIDSRLQVQFEPAAIDAQLPGPTSIFVFQSNLDARRKIPKSQSKPSKHIALTPL